MVDFYYPSVKNQRFLTAPQTRGAFERCGAHRSDKLKFERFSRLLLHEKLSCIAAIFLLYCYYLLLCVIFGIFPEVQVF